MIRPEGDKSHRRLWGAAALLVCATVVAYFPELHGGFVWDDDNILTQNHLIKAADGLYRFWFTLEPADYWPVTSSTLWVEWRLWGMHAVGYHATNLALHIFESLLLWAILRRLRMPGAWLAAFIFALHPVNVESVAWIAQRKNLMAMLFFLLSIFWFLKTDPASPPDPVRLYRPGAGRWYGLSLLALALGMLSKGSVAMLPVVLLGLIAWHRKLAIRDLICAAPFFVVAAIFAGVDVWFTNHGMAVSIRNAGFLERLLGAGAAVWFYLYKALVPLNLIFVYPQWHIETSSLLWWAPFLAAAAATSVVWHYRTSWSRPALFAWGYFCVMLVPVLGFTDIYFMKYSLVADHYEHLAIIAPIVFVSVSLALALRRFQRLTRAVVQVLVVLIVGSLGILTSRQCRKYADNETLFQATLEGNPRCWLAYNILGNVSAAANRMPEAIARFEESVRLEPRYPDAQYNLGMALFYSGRLKEAISHYEQALQAQPHFLLAHYSLAQALAAAGRTEEAIAHYNQVLLLKPGFAEAHEGLGVAFAKIGRLPEAIAQLEESLRLKPDDAIAHYNLGMALFRSRRLGEAVTHYERALELNPDYTGAHNNLGVALAGENRIDEAVVQLEQAVRIDPHNPTSHYNLGSVLRRAGRLQEARAQLEIAAQLRKNQIPGDH